MAVEANVRKRKHSHKNEEEVVPKKIHKANKTPKKHKAKETKSESEEKNDIKSLENHEIVPEKPTVSEKTDAQDSGFEEKPIKFSNDFKMLNFRTKLRGTNFITELRHFLYLMDRKTHIVAKYIEKRGKPLELAEALERIDKTNLLHIGYLCQALQAVVMEIVSSQPAHMESAVSACRYFLKVHSTVIEQLLESANVNHRRIALKLLTAIVCVDPQMGRQILAAFNVLSDVRKIDQHLSHSKFEQNDQETVRKCFIHFVLAFLVDGNPLLIQNILDRSALVQALVFGLLYDDHSTVCLVLRTLKKYVLENANISKTKKIHVFDLECCKRIARLYDWCGPKVFASKFTEKKGTTSAGNNGRIPQEKLETLIDPEEKEAVSATVHEFLLTLLSSRKHGITFDAITHFRQKHNSIQGKVIGFIQKPWCCARKAELVLKILKACPDLARHTVRHFSTVIKPQRTGDKEWVAAAGFFSDVISTLHPDLLGNALTLITLTDFSFWIKDICLPLDTLVSLKGSNMLRHSNAECRLATHRLLLAMFTQYSNFMDAAMQREQSKGSGSSLRRFKFDLFNHILTHFPSIDHILQSLHLTTIALTADPKPILEHLNVTLDLILIICKQNRSFVNRTSTILDYLKLIRPLYTGEEEDAEESDEEGTVKPASILANHGDIKLELKAIKTILLLHPNALEPHQKLFSNVLRSFIKGFVHGSDDVQRECGKLLRQIFKNTGIFDTSALEIDLWLEALRFSDADTVEVATQVFLQVLKVTQADVDFPIDIDTEKNAANLRRLFENIEKGHSVQTYVDAFAISKLLPLIFKGVEIVKPLDKYLELVCLLLFHYHPTPVYVSKMYEMKFESPSRYMSNWLNSGADSVEVKSPSLPKVCHQIPFLKELQTTLLKDYKNVSFESLFCISNEEDTFEIEVQRKTYKLPQSLKDERLLMIHIQQVIFIVSQLLEKQQLNPTQAELAAEYVKIFLAIVCQVESENCGNDFIYTDEGSAVTKQSFLDTIMTYIYDTRFGCFNSSQLCSSENEHSSHYMQFIRSITEYCSEMNNFSNYVKNFCLKIVKGVAISLETVEESKGYSNSVLVMLIDSFQLNGENCVELLNLLCNKLKYTDFFLQTDDGFKPTFYYELLMCTTRRLGSLQRAIECQNIIKSLSKFYVHFVKKLSPELNLEDFEEVFYNLLCVMHQYIPQLDSKLFTSMFAERKISKWSIKLACLLLERNGNLDEQFLNLLPTHVGKRELIYPLLEIAFKKQIAIDSTLLATIYQEYRNGFMKTIEKPQKAGVIYKEYASCSVALVNACMPVTECIDFCKKRFQFNDASELYQIRLIQAIYEKALNSLEKEADGERDKIFVNFLNLCIQLLSADLKRHLLVKEKIELFGYEIFSWFEKYAVDTKNDFTVITKSQHWQNFCKSCLKLGMQVDEVLESDYLNGLLLKLMTYLCDKFYKDIEGTESSEENEPREPAQLFEMVCTHSKYYETVLSPKSTQLKATVLHLLFTLGKKSPSLALPHLEVPVILGSYHAKLSDSDRYALALLQLYEQHNPQGLKQYRPFIWGDSAISFYALHVSDLDERTRLTQQETTISLVMSLIDRHTCEYTIDNFPIWRKLNAIQQLSKVEFMDPSKRALYKLGANDLERQIELNWSEAKSTVTPQSGSIDLRICPKNDGVYLDCYDPAFFIPLMSSCFAPESFVQAVRPVQNGLLAMCFSALSSQDKEMRQAAGIVQLRYRTHFEQSKFFERPLWIQAYENIQAGLAELSENWKQKHKKHSKDYQPVPRVPYIPALFIARTFNITNDPTDLLYKQLTMYLRLKNTFNFQCIPEFNMFFHSPEVEHHTFRQYIIDIIRKGVKCSSDLFLLVTTNTFKVLLGFYGGSMSTLETNLLILSALSTCVKIPASSKIMIEHIGILPWLETVISTLEFYHFDVIEGIISILNNLWYSVTATRNDFHNYNYVVFQIYHLILAITPLLSGRITALRFAKLMNIMQKTAAIIATSINGATPYAAITDEDLDKLISCAEKHFGENVQHLKNLKTLGGAGAESSETYCANLHDQAVGDEAVLALSSLRTLIIDWWRNQDMSLTQVSTNKEESSVVGS